MKLSEQYFLLKDLFDLKQDLITIPGSTTSICNIDFSVPTSIYDNSEGENSGIPGRDDCKIIENRKFKYPLFLPRTSEKYSSVIILLHGLNERSWYKHLAWARYLCEYTGKPVLMFPISFHMNRSLPEWTDRNEMAGGISTRNAQYPDNKELSFANFMLSKRLTEIPQRFFLSGYQSAMDLTSLLKDIRAGGHPYFEKSTSIDVFSYSIGVFLAECMMIANPDNLFDNSRFVFFAGGAVFQEMNGVSKYIMDSKAFERIYYYYMKEMDEDIKENPSMRNVLNETGMGKAFRSMVSYDGLRNFREKALKKYRTRVLAIPLLSDKVIPSVPTVELLSTLKICTKDTLKIMDFAFPYIHENPFPVNLKEYSSQIDDAYSRVFSLSGSFLA